MESVKSEVDNNMVKCLSTLLIMALSATGLFYEFLGCIFCGIEIVVLMVIKKCRKELVLYFNIESSCIVFIVLMYFTTIFYGIDYGMALIGFLRMLSVVFFMICTMQCTNCEENKVFECIPMLGCVMTLSGGVVYMIPTLRSVFFQAGRFGGYFLYANVYALFCTIALIFICKDEYLSKADIIKIIVLVAGVMMSGSRTAFVLLVFVSVVVIVKKRKMRFIITMIVSSFLAIAVFYVLYTGDLQNIGRFLTTSMKSSTLLGRILYAKDGIRHILKQPFGNGYLGYYFIEPVIQTGVYSVRYIHNDYLQMALDIGVMPALLFICIILKNIFSRRLENWKRLIMFVMAVHFIMDFDLEFMGMWIILIFAMNPRYGKKIRLGYNKICFIPAIVIMYVGIAMIPRYVGYSNISYRLLPFYTEAGIDKIEKETDVSNAEQMADTLLKQNKYIHQAYDIEAIIAYNDGRYQEMEKKKWKSVRLQKYNMDDYNRYVMLISHGIAETKSMVDVNYLLHKVIRVKDEIEKVKNNTDTLAWKIRDIPEFTLSNGVSDYIDEAKMYED